MNAYVQIIKEDLGDETPAAMASHLTTVSQAAQQMGRQIDGLMELSRLTRAEMLLNTVAIGPMVRDVCAEMVPALTGRVVEWQVAPDFPALRGDAALLRQVWEHLLSNACKFTRTRPVAQINISWQVTDNGLCTLTVDDNGVGFNPHYKDKLFHAFQRLHGAREFDGMGMGLALSRKIIERHGGTVGAEGVKDAGCRVSFTLPLA